MSRLPEKAREFIGGLLRHRELESPALHPLPEYQWFEFRIDSALIRDFQKNESETERVLMLGLTVRGPLFVGVEILSSFTLEWVYRGSTQEIPLQKRIDNMLCIDVYQLITACGCDFENFDTDDLIGKHFFGKVMESSYFNPLHYRLSDFKPAKPVSTASKGA